MKKTKLLVAVVLSTPAVVFAGEMAGPYAGAGLGYVSGKDSGYETSGGAPDGWTQETTPSGVAFGVFGGYRWKVASNLRLGVEAEFEQRSASSSENQALLGVPDPQYTAKTELQAAYSLRANIGYVFAGGRTQAFATAGFGVASIKRTFTDSLVPASQSTTESQSGLTVGLGMEQQMGKNISMKAEIRYADYGSGTADTTVVYGAGVLQEQKYTEQSLRVGAIYHF